MTDSIDLLSGILSSSKENDLEIEDEHLPIFCIENPFLQKLLFFDDNQEKKFLLMEKDEEKENILFSINLIDKKKKNSKDKKRKKGRKKKEKKNDEENIIQKKIKSHDENRTDNILRKIQSHYLSFIESYLNEILEYFGYKERFQRLDYKFKKKIKKKFVKSLNEKTIGEIISNKISIKYRYKKEDFNQKLLDKLKKDNKVLNNIFSQNYLTVFQKVYYKNKNKINLKDFGLDEDKDIILSGKVKMFKDLLSKNKNSFLHVNKINKYIKINYYPELIFSLNYY